MPGSGDRTLRRHVFQAMGSPCEIAFPGVSEAVGTDLIRQVVADIARLEQRYSRYRADSFLSEINRVADVGGSITVDSETAALLDYADTCHRQSGGLFDITSGLLRRAWRFDAGVLPHPAEIASLLGRIGWHRVGWHAHRLSFQPGMALDLGGIVKEYAADRAATLCLDAGVGHGFVNLGGDIRVMGPQTDGAPWRIGIRHPAVAGALLGILEVHHGAVATSGDYERCMTVAGKRYGHVLHPVTGWPVGHLASVTVLGALCVVTGSAATIGMLKEDAGPAWLAELGLPHLWVDTTGAIGGPLAEVCRRRET